MIKNIKISALNRTEYDKNDACWGEQIIIASFHTLNFIAVVSKSNFSARFSWGGKMHSEDLWPIDALGR